MLILSINCYLLFITHKIYIFVLTNPEQSPPPCHREAQTNKMQRFLILFFIIIFSILFLRQQEFHVSWYWSFLFLGHSSDFWQVLNIDR
jgi:hypothetical protein